MSELISLSDTDPGSYPHKSAHAGNSNKYLSPQCGFLLDGIHIGLILEKEKNGIAIEKTAKTATHSLHALKFLLKLVFESGSSSDAACLVNWQGPEREENSSEVITTLLTSLPAHGGSLITESFAYCPCFLLMPPT